jgi:carboxymethylenebutenolidase
MCFDLDSRPPILPIAGGALDQADVTLESADGNRFRAFRARAATPIGAGMLVLPDVRGLHPYYEELALRLAENGIDAIAIDYFGRTAGLGPRGDGFEHMPHVAQVTFAGLRADVGAAAESLRLHDEGRVRSLFAVGFCFGGRIAFLTSTLGLGLAGSIGFYGVPVGPGRIDIPAPVDVTGRMANPILGLFGGSDAAIPPEAIVAFDAALNTSGVEHRFVTYDGAPHSFFDKKAAEFASASSQAWEETLTFVRGHTASPITAEA